MLSKPAIWLFSLIISIALALVLEINVIGAEEYAQFDHSHSAKNQANILKSIQAFYVISITIIHLIIVIRFLVKKFNKIH